LAYSRDGSKHRDPCGNNKTGRRCGEIHRYRLIFALGYLVNVLNSGVAVKHVTPPPSFDKERKIRFLEDQHDIFDQRPPKIRFLDDMPPQNSDDPSANKSEDHSEAEKDNKIPKNPPVIFQVYEIVIGVFLDLVTMGVMLLAGVHDIAIITKRNILKHGKELARKGIRAEANRLSSRKIKAAGSIHLSSSVSSSSSFVDDYVPITNEKRETIGRAPPALRPNWLSMNGAKQDTLDALCWAISIEDWVKFVNACINTETWQHIISAKEEKAVTMYDLNQHFVKPWTKGTGCSVGGLFGDNDAKVGKIDIMISHAWSGSVVETMSAIQSLVSLFYLPKDTRIFFCTFCMYQPEDNAGPSIADQLALNSFSKIIESLPKYGMFVIHTSISEVYERMWCVHEVDEGLLAKINIFGAFDSSSWNNKSFKKIVKSVKTKDAKCQEKDLVMLTKLINDRGGFDRLDKKIAAFRKLAKQDLATALLFEELFSLNITSIGWIHTSFLRIVEDFKDGESSV